MWRLILVPAVLVGLAVMPVAASAQGPPDDRARFTDEFVDDDFCGTGVSVQGVESTVTNVWEGEETFKVTFRSSFALTYGATTVYALNTGQFHVQQAEGELPGDLVVETGVRAMLRIPGQGVVTIDHGYLAYLVSFDENGDIVDVEVLKDAGGHPDFYDPVWCDAAVEALGITPAQLTRRWAS